MEQEVERPWVLKAKGPVPAAGAAHGPAAGGAGMAGAGAVAPAVGAVVMLRLGLSMQPRQAAGAGGRLNASSSVPAAVVTGAAR